MKPYNLAEFDCDYLKDAEYNLAVLTWGAIEAYNYYLPYSTEVIEKPFLYTGIIRVQKIQIGY